MVCRVLGRHDVPPSEGDKVSEGFEDAPAARGTAWRRFRQLRWWWQAAAWICGAPIVLALLAASKPAESRARWWALAAVVAVAWVGGVVSSAVSDPDEPVDEVSVTDVADTSDAADDVATTVQERTTTTVRRTTTTTEAPTTTTTLDPKARTAAAIGLWYSAGGGDVINTIGQIQGEISDAAADLDVVELISACRSLRDEVREGQDLPPIPAASVDVEWQEALRDFNLAATFCISGAESLDAEALGQSADLITKGSDAIGRATAALLTYR
jgi:hypothetical protein